MYYSEFIAINDKQVALLHDDDDVMFVGIVSDEYEKIEYVTASDLRRIADRMDE